MGRRDIVTLLIDGKEVEYERMQATKRHGWNAEVDDDKPALVLARTVDGQMLYTPISPDDPRIVPNAGILKRGRRRFWKWITKRK